jgi:o-succinylbenzoate synthase
MRITSVHVRRHGGEGSGPMGPAGRSVMTREGALLTLTDDRGTTGVGEASPLPGYSPDTLDEAMASLESGAASLLDAALPEALADIHLDVPSPAARFALETALLDLLGRRQGVPARALLGAPRAVAISGYAGAAGASGVVAAVRALLDVGIGTVKVKVGGGSFEADRAAVARLRGELGDAWTLRLDANGAWSLDEARANLESLAAYDISLVEQPVAGAELLQLGETAIPWAADESLLLPAVRDRLLDPKDRTARLGCAALVLKPALLGGFLACDAIARRAAPLRLGVIVTHLFDGPVALAACRALARSLSVTPLASGLGPHPGLAAWAAHPFAAGPWVGDDDAPGLGVDPAP